MAYDVLSFPTPFLSPPLSYFTRNLVLLLYCSRVANLVNIFAVTFLWRENVAQWGMIRKSVGQGMVTNQHDIGSEARIPFALYDFRFYSKFDAVSLL